MNSLVVCPKCEKLNRVFLQRTSSGAPVCGSCKSVLPFIDQVQEVSASALTKLIRSADRPVIVDFWAEWCGPCKAFAPTFKNAAKELAGQIIFAKINTELFPQVSQAFKIKGIPTLIIFKNGIEVDRTSGALPISMLLEFIQAVVGSS